MIFNRKAGGGEAGLSASEEANEDDRSSAPRQSIHLDDYKIQGDRGSQYVYPLQLDSPRIS
jgi:hypothetical protein